MVGVVTSHSNLHSTDFEHNESALVDVAFYLIQPDHLPGKKIPASTIHLATDSTTIELIVMHDASRKLAPRARLTHRKSGANPLMKATSP